MHSRVCVVDAGWPYAQRNQTRRSRNHNVLCISWISKYVLPEAGSDDIQIPISNCTRQIWDYEVVLPIFGSVNLLVDTMLCTNILVGTLFSVIRQNTLNKHVHSRVCVVDAGWPYAQRHQTRRSRTTTCCAYRGYPKYVLPEGKSDDIQISDIKLHMPNLGSQSCATDLVCQFR